MKIKTKNNKRTEEGSRQESSHERTTENGNHTEETQHGPSPAPTNIGATAKQGSTYNKRIRWSREEMKEVVWCFLCAKDITTENYKAAYKLWRKRNPNFRTNMDAKLLLNQKNYISKNKKITDTETDEIKESFRPRKQDNMEDQIREEQTNNVGATEEHRLTENRNLGEDTQQHVAGEKLKEELEIMWYKVRLLQMSERQRLPKLVENNKIMIKKEVNGIIKKKLLKENENDITDLNHLIYAAATVITEKVIRPGKTVKSRRN
jgi:hypothetical protein